MSIEEMLRNIIREEIDNAFKKFGKPEVEEEGTPVAEYIPTEPVVEEPVEVEEAAEPWTTARLLAEVRGYCADKKGAGKQAKEVASKLGYEKISLVPDEKAQEVFNKIMGAFDAQ